jgi:hypothetical protein
MPMFIFKNLRCSEKAQLQTTMRLDLGQQSAAAQLQW